VAELQISHFCDLFGFNSTLNPVSRVHLKIGSEYYPTGYEFVAGTQYGPFKISEHLDDKALLFQEEQGTFTLHMFVPEGDAPSRMVNCTPEKALYRYSKLKYIEDAYETGHMVIFPALEYAKADHNAARQDMEHVHTKKVASSHVIITTQNGKAITPIGDVTFHEVHMPTDSYILCLSYEYDEAFYEWFEDVDACLVIEDVPEFSNRIHAAMNKVLPYHLGMDHRVVYGKHQSQFGVLFSKPKTYLRQREYRFSWVPEASKQLMPLGDVLKIDHEELKKLIPPPVHIWAGPLKDIARIVRKAP